MPTRPLLRRSPPLAAALLALLGACRAPDQGPDSIETGSRPAVDPDAAADPGSVRAPDVGPDPTESPPGGPAEPPAPWPPDATELVANAEGFVLRYASEPAPMPINEPFRLLVGVRGPAGPLEGPTRLSVDAWMPEHLHGLVRRPVVRELEPGRWAVEGLLLHMPGRWELFFDLTRGPLTERAQDELELD